MGAARVPVLTGIGAALPATVETNDDLAARIDTNDEWIRTRTGIHERRVAEPGQTSLHLAVDASTAALKHAGAASVDAVICATTTPDRMCPGNAPAIASALGLGPIAAFDLQAVCTGFVYATAAAAGLIAAGIADQVLVVGSESIVRFLHPEDRSTLVIFGDGAGAAVVRAGTSDELGAFGPFDLGADGEGADLIAVDAGAARTPPGSTEGATREHYLFMDGREVYRRAIPTMAESSEKALQARGWTTADVHALVGHQANKRILDGVARRLSIPEERCIITIDRTGNTAAASIPLAMVDGHARGLLHAGDKVLVTAFGGGLTWGSTTLTWPDLPPLDGI